MIRTLAFLQRRPDITRRAFRDHYETQHAPLASKQLVGLEFYVRNHILQDRGFGSGGASALPFDVVTEFQYNSGRNLAAIAEMLQSEGGRPILEDELKFMHKPGNFFRESTRSAVAGQRPLPGSAAKSIFLIKDTATPAPSEAAAIARALGQDLVQDSVAVAAELDSLTNTPDAKPKPWDLALSIWWNPESHATARLERPGEELAQGRSCLALRVEECGSLDFDYAAEYARG